MDSQPASETPSILIACIGNIFLGDDGFGCEVAKGLVQRSWPENVKIVDFGIRGFDLTYALLDGYDVTIFVDATPRGGEPGTLYTIEPELSELDELETNGLVDAHSMNPVNVLRMAKSMGCNFRKILLVGCEPATLGPEEGQMGLSEPVSQAVPEAVKKVELLVAELTNRSNSNLVTDSRG
jgi:hydrogenase maturation protease